MKTRCVLIRCVFLFAICLSRLPAFAGTTIDSTNRYACGANIGWIDWYADNLNGMMVTDYYCTGYIYSANCGWINLGNHAPTNGIHYQNLTANDFGVNNDGLGNLRGYAWGANVGWINFESNGAPMLDLITGRFGGYVWSANCGWISLSNAVAFVQSDHILEGPLAPNGLPIPWLLANFGTTNVNADADADGDGQSNAQEYLAGTNPLDPQDNLRITKIQHGYPGDPHYVRLGWPAISTRLYRLDWRTTLTSATPWQQFVTGFESWPGWNNVAFDDFTGQHFYRVEAVRPLP